MRTIYRVAAAALLMLAAAACTKDACGPYESCGEQAVGTVLDTVLFSW